MTHHPVDPPANPLGELVEIWHGACADFVTLARAIPRDSWDLPTDLEGWTVKDNVAHTAHLEAVLAGAPEETIEVAQVPHVTGVTGHYTEQGVLARRDRDMEALLEEIERSVASRYAALRARPPTDATSAPPRTPAGVPWDTVTLLTNRPLDVWMHEQDIRRAIGRPGGYDSPASRHVLRTFGRSLSMVVGKRLAPPAGTVVRVRVPDADLVWTVAVGQDGRAGPADEAAPATVEVTVSPEDLVLLAGGRRPPEATTSIIEGDQDLGRRLLTSMTVTP